MTERSPMPRARAISVKDSVEADIAAISSIHASIRLHSRFGFEHAGLLPAVGWKHSRWVDSVLLSRALGDGSCTSPAT